MIEAKLKFKSIWESPIYGYNKPFNFLVRRTYLEVTIVSGSTPGDINVIASRPGLFTIPDPPSVIYTADVICNVSDIDNPILAQKLVITKITKKLDVLKRTAIWMAFARHSKAAFKIMGSPKAIQEILVHPLYEHNIS